MSLFYDQIRDLIRQDKLELTLDVLIDFTDNNKVRDTDFSQFQSRLASLNEKTNSGLLSEDSASAELNQIRHGLIQTFKDLINSMEFDDAAAVKLLEEKKEQYEQLHEDDILPIIVVKNEKKSEIKELFSRIFGWAFVISIVALIGLGFLFLKKLYTNNPLPLVDTSKEARLSVKDSLDKIAQADTLTQHAIKLMQEDRWAEAVIKCDSALTYKTEKPMNWLAYEWAEIYNLKAECMLNLGHIVDAEGCSEKALYLDPKDESGELHATYAQIIAEKYGEANAKFMSYFIFSLDQKLPLWSYMNEIGFVKIKKDPSVKRLLDKYKSKASQLAK
jgi:tetratricopeptide (TPR) repeat protein